MKNFTLKLNFVGDFLCVFRIMESLNLLRYLLIRDKERHNEVGCDPNLSSLLQKLHFPACSWCVCDPQTGIWSELCTVEENYLKPLRTGLNMSRAHYEAELKSTKEKKRKNSTAGQYTTVNKTAYLFYLSSIESDCVFVCVFP